MADLLFTGARLLDPDRGLDGPGDLLVRDGRILDYGANLGRPEGASVVPAAGLILAPGLIDLRAAIGEPGAEHRESIASAAGAWLASHSSSRPFCSRAVALAVSRVAWSAGWTV